MFGPMKTALHILHFGKLLLPVLFKIAAIDIKVPRGEFFRLPSESGTPCKLTLTENKNCVQLNLQGSSFMQTTLSTNIKK
jgi:hypothetical protein